MHTVLYSVLHSRVERQSKFQTIMHGFLVTCMYAFMWRRQGGEIGQEEEGEEEGGEIEIDTVWSWLQRVSSLSFSSTSGGGGGAERDRGQGASLLPPGGSE